jgi:hypothetical protein
LFTRGGEVHLGPTGWTDFACFPFKVFSRATTAGFRLCKGEAQLAVVGYEERLAGTKRFDQIGHMKEFAARDRFHRKKLFCYFLRFKLRMKLSV